MAVTMILVAVACAPLAAPRADTAVAGTNWAETTPVSGTSGPALEMQRPARVVVRMGGLGGAIDRALFVGEAKGFYDEQGIDLETQTFTSAGEMIPLLATDRLDAGHGGTNAGFFNAILAGIPLKIVSAASVLREPRDGVRNVFWIVVRQELTHQVQSVSGLKGLRLGILGIDTRARVERALAYHGLKLDDVHLEHVAFPDQLAALSNGAIDAAATMEPFITLGQDRNILVPLFDMGQVLPDYPVQVLFYGPEFLRNQPEAGKRFLVAYMRALRYIENAFQKGINREEVVQLFVDNTPIKDAALYERMALTFNETNGNINGKALDMDQDFYIAAGLQREKIGVWDLVDTRFVEYAVQVLGRY